MKRVHCDWCGGNVVPGTTCPKSLACPKCSAGPGQRCKRPSGHEAMTLHDDRIKLAEEQDKRNARLPDELFTLANEVLRQGPPIDPTP